MINILFDCDPGIDDAVMLALAKAWEKDLNVLGICAAAGNQTLDKTARNALDVSEFFGLDADVAAGCDGPLVRKLQTAGKIHGENGLGNVTLPRSKKQLCDLPGARFMAEKLKALPAGEKAWLVPTGPLTNSALLLKTFPEVKEKLEGIVLMGGSTDSGNVTPAAEFNIYVDPEAAEIVFNSGLPVIMCGLDVTNNCSFSQEQVNRMKMESGRARKAAEMLQFYLDQRHEQRGEEFAAVHDAVTITWLLHPDWFRGRRTSVHVDTSFGPSAGHTICDLRPSPEDGLVTVLLDADYDKIVEAWMAALLQLDQTKY